MKLQDTSAAQAALIASPRSKARKTSPLIRAEEEKNDKILHRQRI